MVGETDCVQVAVADVRLSASADSLFATSFSWWERWPEALSKSRLQPGFSIGVSTVRPSDLWMRQLAEAV
jgi:hypothetical protein